MRTSSLTHYRAFVKVLLASALLLVVVTICDLASWCPPFPLASRSTQKIKLSLPKLSSSSSSLDLSVEDDNDSLRGKCVAVRIKGIKETLTLDEVLSKKVQLPSSPKVGLIFLDKTNAFLSSGKVVNSTGVFHLYHYLEFLLVAYQQLQELQEHYDATIYLSSPDSPVQVPWIYVPLLQSPLEVCGVANGINCRIASLLLQSPSWYGMESNPSELQATHPAYHGQHSKRQWDEDKMPLKHQENYPYMQETADMAFIISLRHKDRCNHKGRIRHGWNEYSDVFPSKAWHDSLIAANLESFPLPSELTMPKSHELLVCYIDRQVTPRRMPDSEHVWLLKYLQQHSKIRLWHLMMQNYDGMVQLRIASECQVMIGVHGNGLSHLLWMRPKSHVVELYWDDETRQGGYELLARTMQHNYMAIRNGWLVLDSTHPVYEKQVHHIEGVDPLQNGRQLIEDFLENVLVIEEIPQHVDNWGDTHPRQCDGQPKHIHLAVGHDPRHEMTISFASEWSDLRPPRIAGVRYGKSPDHLDMFAQEQGPPISYNTTYPSDSKAQRSLYFSPYQHHITLKGLEAGTTYYYLPILKDDDDDSTGGEEVSQGRRFLAPKPYNGFKKSCTSHEDVRTFKTAPLEQKPRRNKPMVTFGIVGDLGQFTHSQKTMARMEQDSLDLVLLVGDIAYTSNDHRRWDTFFDFLDDFPLFHTTPLQIATGNHDIEKSSDRPDIFQSYESRFRMPQVRPAELGTLSVTEDLDMNEPPYPLPYEWGNAYYSFLYGPSKHIVVSAYSSMEPESTQYEWLVKELASVNRTETPWVLVSMHVPFYNTFDAHHRDLQVIAAQEHLEPLFVKYTVNMVFTGHIHAYQRTRPVEFGEVVETGPVHVTVGSSGRQCCLTPFVSKKPEPWIASRDGTHYGYGRLAIFNQTHAEWQWVPTSSLDARKALPPNDIVMVENQYFLKER